MTTKPDASEQSARWFARYAEMELANAEVWRKDGFADKATACENRAEHFARAAAALRESVPEQSEQDERIERIEVNDDATLDEVVTHGSAHFEMLDDGAAFLRLGPLAILIHASSDKLCVNPRDGGDFRIGGYQRRSVEAEDTREPDAGEGEFTDSERLSWIQAYAPAIEYKMDIQVVGIRNWCVRANTVGGDAAFGRSTDIREALDQAMKQSGARSARAAAAGTQQ